MNSVCWGPLPEKPYGSSKLAAIIVARKVKLDTTAKNSNSEALVRFEHTTLRSLTNGCYTTIEPPGL